MSKNGAMFLAFAIAVATSGCVGSEERPGEPGSDLRHAVDGDSVADPTDDPWYGTEINPIALGEGANIGDWRLAVRDVDIDASNIEATEGRENDALAHGSSFVLVGVQGSYSGDGNGTIGDDLTFEVRGTFGDTFSASCGTIPNDVIDAAPVPAGAAIEGNICIRVSSEQLTDVMLAVEEIGGERVLFSIALGAPQ